jgi:hypothetical protein
MADLDLRPLSLGEILDRTFSLYRRNFLLFLGIVAIPNLLVLALNLVQMFLGASAPSRSADPSKTAITGAAGALVLLLAFAGGLAYLVAYLFAQGGTVYAVSELYLGRPTTIGASLNRMRGHAANLFGVTFLNGLAVGAGLIALILPGIWLSCRLLVCVPAALLEDLGPGSSLGRSFELTKGYAFRSLVIYVLYIFLILVALLVFMFPFQMVAAIFTARNPEVFNILSGLSLVGDFVATILVTPILTIATAVFYYDLRVRKEAFDLQLMMNPSGAIPAAGSGPAGVPTMFS